MDRTAPTFLPLDLNHVLGTAAAVGAVLRSISRPAPAVEKAGGKTGPWAQQRRRKMKPIERRNFIQGVGLAAGAAAATTLVESPALAQAPAPSCAAPPTHPAKPLSLGTKGLKWTSEKSRVSP